MEQNRGASDAQIIAAKGAIGQRLGRHSGSSTLTEVHTSALTGLEPRVGKSAAERATELPAGAAEAMEAEVTLLANNGYTRAQAKRKAGYELTAEELEELEGLRVAKGEFKRLTPKQKAALNKPAAEAAEQAELDFMAGTQTDEIEDEDEEFEDEGEALLATISRPKI